MRTREVLEFGLVLAMDMPPRSTRQFHIHTKPLSMNPQPDRCGSNEAMVIAGTGQVGTRFDMFPHRTIGGQTY